MKTIFQVKISDNLEIRLFSTQLQAEKYCQKLMKHFGGEWDKKEYPKCISMFVSKRVFEKSCLISRMCIRIVEIKLDETPLPKFRIKESYIDYENKEIFKLGR